jgi:TRAP transporter TAXI family solute receptor
VTNETRIGIATGNATGVYFALGNAYAAQLGAGGGKVKATAAETGASVQNIQQLVAGTYGVAFSLADTAADAINGTNSFTSKQPIAALARIHTNYTQVIVRKAAGIKDVAGMRGKRVSTGSPKSGTEVIANRLLTAAGLDPAKDVRAQRLDLTKTVDGMKDGSIDALFWSGGLPTPGITDLLTTSAAQVDFLDITPVLPAMQKINPVYEAGVIPAATYRTAAEVKTIVVPNLLLVRNDLDANVACVLTRALFDRKEQLVQANAAAKEINLDTARKTDPVPLHRGATKALDDLGAPK